MLLLISIDNQGIVLNLFLHSSESLGCFNTEKYFLLSLILINLLASIEINCDDLLISVTTVRSFSSCLGKTLLMTLDLPYKSPWLNLIRKMAEGCEG